MASSVVSLDAQRPEMAAQGRVLIVDDIPENRRLLEVLCTQLGLTCESVEGGREAVEAARTGGFDLILMDVFMPGMDGMSATRAIRSLPGRPAFTPIIAVTTAAEPGNVLRYLDCGMNAVVAKPVQPAVLAQALSAAMQLVDAHAGRRRRPRKRAAQAA